MECRKYYAGVENCYCSNCETSVYHQTPTATKPRVLVIDDDPIRVQDFERDIELALACGEDQIRFWLSRGPWDIIYLDHDMGRQVNGTWVVKNLGTELVTSTKMIVIWSHNYEAARAMHKDLKDLAISLGIDNRSLRIRREAFGAGNCYPSYDL